MSLRKSYVQMDEIIDALESHGDSTRFFLDTRSGEVSLWIDPLETGDDNTFDPDDERYAEIPQRESRDEHREMEQFVLALDEPDVRGELQQTLQGRGAFGRFRAALVGYPDVSVHWEQHKRDRLLAEAIAWLAEIGIEPQFELRPIEPAPPGRRPGAHPEQARVGLFDLLLLGAPHGTTEIVDGRVRRLWIGANEDQARQVFARVARELAEHHGLSWRRRSIENTDRFAIDRFVLLVSGRQVELSVEMPRTTWDAFSSRTAQRED